MRTPSAISRSRMTETGTLKRVMKASDWQLHKKGYMPMLGQLVNASLVPAPTQRNTDGEREAIKAGKTAQEIWPDEAAKAARKDTDARLTLKIGGKVRYRPDGAPTPMIASPVFGYKSNISIDRRYSFIRAAAVTSAPILTAACSAISLIGRTPAARSGQMPTAHRATRLGWAIAC